MAAFDTLPFNEQCIRNKNITSRRTVSYHPLIQFFYVASALDKKIRILLLSINFLVIIRPPPTFGNPDHCQSISLQKHSYQKHFYLCIYLFIYSPPVSSFPSLHAFRQTLCCWLLQLGIGYQVTNAKTNESFFVTPRIDITPNSEQLIPLMFGLKTLSGSDHLSK